MGRPRGVPEQKIAAVTALNGSGESVRKIAKAPESSLAEISGMFGVSVAQSNDESVLVHFVITDNVDKAVMEIDKNYQFQNVALDDIELKIRFNNDLRTTIKYEIEGPFVNDNPVDAPLIFELKRRDMIEIVPSNVKSQSMIKTGSARFARLIL